MQLVLHRIGYGQLNARQKENYNFQKAAAVLADYGFNCLRLTHDWHGADFIACHIDGSTFLKVQLKGRLTIDQKYQGKNVYIMFGLDGCGYLYPHDEVMGGLADEGLMVNSSSWQNRGAYSSPRLSRQLREFMRQYEIGFLKNPSEKALS